MSLNNLGMGFVFTARDLASAKLVQLERRFSSLDERVGLGTARMRSSFRQLGVGMATFTAGAALVAGGLALANAAGKFELGVASVGAVTKATTDQLQQLRDAAIEAGMVTQFSPEEAVEGLQSLATAGQTVAQATRTLVPVLDLAAGSLGQLGVAQAAEAVVGTLNAYSIAASEAGNVTDRLLRITQLTNFQTRDFESGLSKAASSGAVFGQTLDDVLITMGLLRNRNIDASSSSTAFRESVRRVGSESRAQQALTEAGIAIFEKESGKMRSIIDIMSDFAAATRTMTDEERNRRVAVAFGARGLLAFNAVMNASFTTQRDGREVTLLGAEAIGALRNEMLKADGTAQAFREQLLDTFEGQKTLLRGLTQTLAVLLGEPFSAVFKPIVRGAVTLMNGLLQLLQSIPAPLKRAFAGLTVGLGAFTALVGALIAGKAAAVLLGIGLKAVGLSLGGILAAMWPAVLAVGALSAAIAGFAAAYRANLGGLATHAERLLGSVKRFFQALSQLFSAGELSGALQRELARAENFGLKRFAIGVWQLAWRLGRAWEGVKAGFASTAAALTLVFERLTGAFSQLKQAVGSLVGSFVGAVAALPSVAFKDFGERVGSALATVLGWVVRVATVLLGFYGQVVHGLSSVLGFVKPALGALRDSAGELVTTLCDIFGRGDAAEAGLASFGEALFFVGKTLGKIVGVSLGVAALALSGLITVVRSLVAAVLWLIDAFVALDAWQERTAVRIRRLFSETIPSGVRAAIEAVQAFSFELGAFFSGLWDEAVLGARTLADSLCAALQPVAAFFEGLGARIEAALSRLREALSRVLRGVPSAALPAPLVAFAQPPLASEVAPTPLPRHPAQTPSTAFPAAAELQARERSFAAVSANLGQPRAQNAPTLAAAPPIHIELQVDGETLARATHRADRERASRSFSPLPVY